MVIEDGKKLRFGPTRIRMAAGGGFIAALLGVGSLIVFQNGKSGLAWTLLILAFEIALMAISVMTRYIRFSVDGFECHGYKAGIVPFTRFTPFKEIRRIELKLGPKSLGLSDVTLLKVFRKDGGVVRIISISGFKVPDPSNAINDRFYRLIQLFGDAILAASR
jgi:hypothetical protein